MHLRGRSTADIVIAEKIREDRLRALGLGVFRWDWPVAISLPALGGLLSRNGIPRALTRHASPGHCTSHG
jgi:hypothetical protein